MVRLVKVELLSLLPTVYSNKCKAFCVSVHDSYEMQISEYPRDVAENQVRVSVIYRELVREFGSILRLSVVNPLSPRGAWLMMRHRLPNGIWAVIDGREVVDASRGAEAVKEAVKRRIRSAPREAAQSH
ncbi:MAG: hypothetical protein NXY59_00755 [Aigarchaeota archaeon]|nr:hypothetical protein [Candidatus Pelearchaeum maunauluense]